MTRHGLFIGVELCCAGWALLRIKAANKVNYQKWDWERTILVLMLASSVCRLDSAGGACYRASSNILAFVVSHGLVLQLMVRFFLPAMLISKMVAITMIVLHMLDNIHSITQESFA